MKEDAIFLLARLAEFANEVDLDDHAVRIWIGHVEPAIARLRRAVFASVAQDIDPREEIERLQESVRNKTSLLDRQLGTPCEQIRHAEEVATLTVERDAAREGNEAVNEKYNTLLKVLSDVYAERDALRKALEQAQRRLAQIAGREVYNPHLHARTGVAEIDAALTTQPSKTETRDDG